MSGQATAPGGGAGLRRSGALARRAIAFLVASLAAAPALAAPRDALVQALRGRDDAVAVTTLRTLGAPAPAAAMQAIVLDRQAPPLARLRAAALLHTLADAEALVALRSLADAPDLDARLRWHARYGATLLLGRLQPARAAAEASAWLWPGAHDAALPPPQREAMTRALRHVAGARPLLQRLSRDRDPSVRAAAAHVLRRLAASPGR